MDLYNQIYTIISEAIFGQGAQLTANQLFHVEQVSLYLSLAVLLLPIISLIAITVKLLKW